MVKTSELIWQDQQHQVLFQLIDEIKAEHVDASTFQRLHEYAEQHFSLEEVYMSQLEYPDRESHVAAHNKFRTELSTMLDGHHDYEKHLRETLSAFLSEWLKRHIYGVDKKLEEFILLSERK